ncbi:18218_t:CDS:2, partial [Racocetra fulgida]
TIRKAKLKKALLSPSNTINTTNNNNFQQSLSDENSSSSESSDKSSLSLINKQTMSTTLPNKRFWSAPPINENSSKKIIEVDDNNDIQQHS